MAHDSASAMPASAESAKLIGHLRSILVDLCRRPYPHVPNPPDLKKRASVALIIRIKPHYSHWPTSQDHTISKDAQDGARADGATRIHEYLSKPWVQHGEPEVLFIKRASRKGDRWTGHVALPGGRRDPEDADDRATAIRETEEEVGITLDDTTCISTGNLPQRLVTASWGTAPLMILCPYIFLLTTPLPQLRLQPTEVASTHWVPLRYLLAPELRTYESADVSSRLSKQSSGVRQRFLQVMLGSMLFSAVKLIPTETVFCSASPGFGPEPPATSGVKALAENIHRQFGFAQPWPSSTDRPLLLWGLTLGVLADFLELLPPHDALSLWTYPTFSAPDVRLAVWLMSYRFRQEKARRLAEKRQGMLQAFPMAQIEVGLDSVPLPRGRRLSVEARVVEEAEPSLSATRTMPQQVPASSDQAVDEFTPSSPQDRWLSRQEGADGEPGPPSPGSPPPEVGIAGLGAGKTYANVAADGEGNATAQARRQRRSSRSSRVGFMLEGYYDIMRRAVALALFGRLAVVLAFIAWIGRKWLARKRRRAGLL